jgi:Mn2+/Fe2+ NRAMP family transporter
MSIKTKLAQFGPGLLYAGAAIGVSHLVQSTRAGAMFGFQLVWVVLIANVLKYPFFKMGPLYATATGKSLLDGYKKLGKAPLILFLIMTLGTMFTVQAAVTIVTAGLATQLIPIGLSAVTWSMILLSLCASLLIWGRYSLLDKAIKWIILLLAATTITALLSSLLGTPQTILASKTIFAWSNVGHIAFLIALAGWMPGPLDISVWHSTWSVEKQKEKKRSMKMAMLDFNVGYWGTTGLAIAFVGLGALFMYGTGVELSPKAGAFAGQLIDLYTSSLGAWAKPIIGFAAFTTMFSTTLTCLDAFPRVLEETTKQLELKQKSYLPWLAIVVCGSVLILTQFLTSMKSLVDLATSISFAAAPIIAILNTLAVSHKSLGSHRLSSKAKAIAWVFASALVGFSLWFFNRRFEGLLLYAAISAMLALHTWFSISLLKKHTV